VTQLPRATRVAASRPQHHRLAPLTYPLMAGSVEWPAAAAAGRAARCCAAPSRHRTAESG
jgi:hypothetical protein